MVADRKLLGLCPSVSFLLCGVVDDYLQNFLSCTGTLKDPNAQGDAFKTLFVARVVSPQLPTPGALGYGERGCGQTRSMGCLRASPHSSVSPCRTMTRQSPSSGESLRCMDPSKG